MERQEKPSSPNIAQPLRIARRRGSRARAYVAFALCVALLVVWDGILKRPTGPAQGESFQGVSASATTAPTRKFRVATFNIAGGKGRDGTQNLSRTASAMRGCDLLGIQEAHGDSFIEQKDQTQILAEVLKMPWLYAPTERRWWHDSFGNAVITTLPVRYWARIPISTATATSNRNAVLTRVELDGQIMNVLVTHVGRHDDHDPQMRAVVELFLSLGEPAILMGDLNANPDDPQIRRLRATAGVVDAVSASIEPKFPHHVDWIFLRGLRTLQAGASDDGISDHPFVWADVELSH